MGSRGRHEKVIPSDISCKRLNQSSLITATQICNTKADAVYFEYQNKRYLIGIIGRLNKKGKNNVKKRNKSKPESSVPPKVR